MIINPAGHITRFSYDLGTGNLLWQEKDTIKTEFVYDKFGRITKEILPYDSLHTPTKSYTYSFDGAAPESIKISQRTTANKTLDTYYHYDGFGNLVQLKASATDGRQVVKNFFYDGNNRVKAEQNPYFSNFSTVISNVSSTAKYTNYSYDALSRVTNVTNPDNTNATVVFGRWHISTFDENWHRKDYFLDAYDRIIAVTEFNIDAVLNDGHLYLFNTTYDYNAADELTRIIDSSGNNFVFTYDSLGRRTRLNDPDIGEWNYTYDLVNNLVSQAGGGGNLVTGDGFYREYNALNQLVLIRNGSSSSSPIMEQYYYDPFNERIKIWRNDSAGTVVYTPFRELMQIRNSSGVYNFTYVYDGSILVARVNPDGSKHFYHPDHLGSTTLITDQNGNVVEETFYEPYGLVSSGGSSEVKLYTGQFDDELTNQYYYGARYYIPSIGRFGQADTLLPNVYDPQLLNRYSYARNNPFKFVDDSGNNPVEAANQFVNNLNKVMAAIILGEENKKAASNQKYETLYVEYAQSNTNIPADPYIRTLDYGSGGRIIVRYERRMDIDILQRKVDDIKRAEDAEAIKPRIGYDPVAYHEICFTDSTLPCLSVTSSYKTEASSQKFFNEQGSAYIVPDNIKRGGGGGLNRGGGGWNNVVQRADGKWVSEGGSDDDGTRGGKKDSSPIR